MKWMFVFLVCCTSSAYTQILQPGDYRWEITRSDGEKIVFMTRVAQNGRQMDLINGEDRMQIDSIRVQGDSIFIELPFFESSFMVKRQDQNDLTGYWIKKSGGVISRRLPVTAHYGVRERFEVLKKPGQDITGEWATVFTQKDDSTQAAGIFEQRGSRVTGTFRTPYGDYRFLEGVISGDSVFLSGFDGGMAMLFKGKVDRDNIRGKMYSGDAPARDWYSRRGEAQLDEGAGEVKERQERLSFAFPDINGDTVRITDDRYQNKVVVVQIMGSWCPNCLDEMKFIMENYERYRAMGVEFIALAYERTADFETSREALQPFLDRFKVPYPVLIPPVAVSDEQRTEKTLPQLEKITAFPTTIFVDRDGHIAKVHAGFDGPATGIHHEKYKQAFEQTLEDLLKEDLSPNPANQN